MGEGEKMNSEIIEKYREEYLSIWEADLARWEKIKAQECDKSL
ncbi:hypothetical protein EC07798_1844 [Escherichia coli 07798]|nr:hypothetical protein EC07798_1844 [Escherichia coli 07798]KDZ50326.1 hypothetical protein AB16_2909 [Escherichia coli 3-073-06_S1_C1]KEM76125.1 hypothetical protein AC11_2273 [Escherichia coli 6-537-08_S3_C1]KEM83007.1 hypothetical protein AC64_2276 [Escherichia coli 6-537-08_S3_C3]KEN17356.1 hypothetical protein AC39_2361 [Escherichia coli 6-537-08_S3_C2]